MRQNGPYITKLSTKEALISALIFAIGLAVYARAFADGLSIGHDLQAHYYRMGQMLLNIQEGEPFTLWARYSMRGYGYPILMFYAPLSYWSITIIALLGFSLSAAIRLFVVAELFLAGWGIYLLTRRYFEPSGAFIAGISYMFAPYMLYNGTERGAYPELLGLVLMPIVLYAFDQLTDNFSKRQYLKTAVLLVLILLSHNVVPFILFPLLALFVAVRLFIEKPLGQETIQHVAGSAIIIFIALGITAAYWLPALSELQYTHSRLESSEIMGWPPYTSHFMSLSEIVVLPEEPIDPALSNRPWVRSVSITQFFLSLIALAIIPFTKHKRRYTLLAWAFIGCLSLYLLNGHSIWIWKISPLPQYIQLPTRFLGTASLSQAILSGFMADWLIRNMFSRVRLAEKTRPLARTAVLFVFATAVSVTGWQWLYPIYTTLPDTPTAFDMFEAMRWDDSGDVSNWGAAASGETLPQWVSQLPSPTGLVNEQTTDPRNIQRLAPQEQLSIESWSSSPSGDQYLVNVAEATQLTYKAFYFPGWEATLNDQPINIEPSEPYGFITINVPQGNHELNLQFKPTTLRYVAWGITIASVFVLLIGTQLKFFATAHPSTPTSENEGFVRQQVVPMLVVVFLLFGLRVALDNSNTPLRSNRLQQDGTLQGIDQQTNINFSQQFIHLGYSGPAEVASDDQFEMVQYWRAVGGIGVPYGFGLRVVDDLGNVWSDAEIVRPRTYTEYPGVLKWQPTAYVRDPFLITLQPGTPPGEYWLETEAFQRHVAYTLQPFQNASPLDPTQARIGRITITPPRSNELSAYDVGTERQVSISETVDLLGWSLRTGIWKPGELGAIDFLWQATEAQTEDLMGEVQISTESGELISSHPFTLGGSYPVSGWTENQVIRDKIKWVLPAKLPSGELTIQVNVAGELVDLGRAPAEAPDRTFETPTPTYQTNDSIEFANLVGYDLEQADSQLNLKLHWLAVGETDLSYRVFVHIRDQSQQVIAQSDGVPAEWTRPTTSWLTGEYISDQHKIHLSPELENGTYEIFLGIYNGTTGERIGELLLTETELLGE